MTGLSLAEAQRFGNEQVGVLGAPATLSVEASAIRRFAEAIRDPNPVYVDAEYARQTRWGGIIAPPTFLCCLRPPVGTADLNFGSVRLNGGNAFTSHRPVRPGDVITAHAWLTGVEAKQGRTGDLLVVQSETRYVNQDGYLVATGRATGIRR